MGAQGLRASASPMGRRAGAPHEILLAGQGAGWAEPGPALDLGRGGFPGVPLRVGDLRVIAPEGGSRGQPGPAPELGRGARVARDDVSAPALLTATHIVDPFATSATELNT